MFHVMGYIPSQTLIHNIQFKGSRRHERETSPKQKQSLPKKFLWLHYPVVFLGNKNRIIGRSLHFRIPIIYCKTTLVLGLACHSPLRLI
uniref:Uncharacterized protein n=1 Tax=Rhizophora mucronata TaxID=61149 RepID=A0A2P2KC55_RHIMU